MPTKEEIMYGNPADISNGSQTPYTTNIQALLNQEETDSTTTSEQTFKASKANAPNTFGIYDIKQVAKEITPDVSNLFDTSLLDEMNPTSLMNLISKSGQSITSDADLMAALDNVSGFLTDFQQTLLGSLSEDSPLRKGSSVPMDWSYDKFLPYVNLSVGNITDDLEVSSIFPSEIPVDGYTKVRQMFNEYGLNNFNDCPNLMSALGYLKNLLDPSKLFGMLGDLFGFVGDWDISGIIKCVGKVTRQIDTLQRTKLADVLINRGSLNGMRDLAKLGDGRRSILDKYDTVYRTLGKNRRVTIDPRTTRPTNTFDNPMIQAYTDEWFGDIGIDKARVFTANAHNVTKNASILDRLGGQVVQDVRMIKQTDPATKLADYCVGSTAKLLRNIPSFI